MAERVIQCPRQKLRRRGFSIKPPLRHLSLLCAALLSLLRRGWVPCSTAFSPRPHGRHSQRPPLQFQTRGWKGMGEAKWAGSRTRNAIVTSHGEAFSGPGNEDIDPAPSPPTLPPSSSQITPGPALSPLTSPVPDGPQDPARPSCHAHGPDRRRVVVGGGSTLLFALSLVNRHLGGKEGTPSSVAYADEGGRGLPAMEDQDVLTYPGKTLLFKVPLTG